MQNNKISIIRKNIKYANIKVKPTSEVILSVPFDMSGKEIDYILNKRKNWINRQLNLFATHKEPPRELVSGENFLYLGKNYRLKIIESNEEKTKLTRGFFEIYVKNKDDYAKKQKLIATWYKQKAKEHFCKAVHKYESIIKVKVQKIQIRQMKTRWGSCNPHKSYINLNSELIKKPKVAIEYVVFHELVHLIYPYHNKNFYNFLSLHMPDWQERKQKLNELL